MRLISCICILFFMVMTFSSTAQAKSDVTNYKFKNVPDISGIFQKVNGTRDMYVVFGYAYGDQDGEFVTKILKLDLNTQNTKCTTFRTMDIGNGIEWNATPCVSVKKAINGDFTLKVIVKFDFDGTPDYVLKAFDHVKERRLVIHFSKNDAGCNVTVVERSYIPVDGKKPIKSKIGPGVCEVNRGTAK